MAIAINSEMPSNVGVNIIHDGVTDPTWQWSFTNTAGTLLILSVSACEAAGFLAAVVSATYNGVAMTEKVSIQNGTRSDLAYFYLQSPATGANNFIVTVSGDDSVQGHDIAGAISLTGAKTGDPFLSTNTGSTGAATTLTVNLSSVASTSLCISSDQMGSSHSGSPGNRTTSWLRNVDDITSGNNGFMQRVTGVSGTVAMTHNCSASDTIYAIAGEIGEAVAAVSMQPYKPWAQRAPILAQ